MLMVQLPQQHASAFKFVELDWNPGGHEPAGVYDTPHFDFHFYTIDVAQRNAFADYFGEVVYTQSTEPIARAEYVLITPKTRTFFFNKPPQKTEEKGDTKVFSYVFENVPPMRSTLS